METKNAVIESARITSDDHGLLSAWLMLDYGGSGQGFGGYALYLHGWKDRDKLAEMLAAAPTPPSTEDRKGAELWRDLVSHQKFNNVPAVGYAINQAKKRQAMQEDKP